VCQIGVLGDRPEAGALALLVPEYGRFAAQEAKQMVRYAVDEVIGIGEIDVGQIHREHPLVPAPRRGR
jgi:hypothetical protein